MALVESQEVALRISAETSGQSDVSALVDRIEALAREGGEAAPQLAAIADEVRKLGQQKVQIEGLTGAIASAKQARVALVEARHAAQMLDKALGDAKGAGASAQVVKLLQKELSGANRQLAAAERAWAGQTTALRTARTEAAAAGVDVRNLGEAQRAMAGSFADVAAKVDAQSAAMQRARQVDQERAAASRQHAQEEDRLAAIVAASKAKLARAAQDQLAAEKRGYAEASAAAQRYAEDTRRVAGAAQSAFSTIGIRSSKAIQADILGIQQGLQRLAIDARTSGDEFDRAWAAGQKRIAALKAEMSGGVDPFTASVGKATGSVGTFLTRLGPVANAIATAFSIDQVSRIAVQFDSLNRTLAAISGDRAAEELGYITAAATRLGLDLGSASKSYAQFLAVTRGTALEGKGARDVFESVAGAMARLGKSAADTDGAMLALSQMVSKGTVSMEELRQQLAERLPGAMKAAADGAGLTEAELIKMVETGQVLAEDLLPALAGQLNKLYGTSKGVEGYAAGWNRLTSAVTSTIGVFTQSGAVMAAVGANGWLLREAVLVLGTGFVTVAEGVTFFARALGTVAGAIASGNWRDLRDEIGKLAAESSDRINQLASQTAIAKGIQDGFTESVARTTAEAAKGGAGWLAVTNAYAQVNAAADAYVKQTEKSLKAREAESAAIAQYVQAVGTVRQQLDAEAGSAQAVAEATMALSEAKAAQLSTLQSQLVAQEQVIAGNERESSAKQKLVEETRKKIDLAREESATATAAAQQAQLEAATRQVAAAAVADHSARLDELRTAYAAAQAAVSALEEGERAGLVTQQQVVDARSKAVLAAGLYRDAVADTITGIELESRARQSQLTTEERLGQLKLAQIRTSELSARATGNEAAAAWAAVEAKRQEARMAELKARAQTIEAAAQLKKIAAQEAELTAADRLDAVKMAELEAAKASATAKQIEGQISEELAKQLHAEADAAIRAMQAKSGAAEAAAELGASSTGAAEGVSALNSAAAKGGSVASALGEIWNNAKGYIRDASEAAYNAVNKLQADDAGKPFRRFADEVRNLKASANELIAEDPIGQLEADLYAAEGAAELAANEMERLQKVANGAGLGWKSFWDDLSAMADLESALYSARVEHIKLNIEIEKFNQSLEAGKLSIAAQEGELQKLVRRAEELGSENLSQLRQALADVSRQMAQISDNAKDAKDAIQDEIDAANGQYEAIEQRRIDARRADLEAQRAEAKAAGNKGAADDFDDALSRLAELERIQLDQARVRQKEAADRKETELQKERDPARASDAWQAQQSATPAPAQLHRVEIKVGGRTAIVNTAGARDAASLTDILRQLETDAMRAN